VLTLPWLLQFVSVGGFVEDEKGNVLLVKNRNAARGWEFPGGVSEIGEDLEEAVKREIREESGAEVEVIRLIGMYSSVKPKVRKSMDGDVSNTTVLNIDFHCRYIGGSLCGSDETEEARWFSRDEALSAVKHPLTHLRLEAMLKKESRVRYIAFTNPEFEIRNDRYL
jgi:ADP-ribose pyrophosphatase YjhB (NUDIX family)